MTLLIAALGAISIVAFVASAIWFRRALAFVIPLMFAVLFWGAVNAIDYLGYAVDADYLRGTEAVVLDTIQGNEWVYLLVRTSKDKEPRLVRIRNTEKNKQDAEAAMQQAEERLTVIRFGANRPAGERNGIANGVESTGPAFEILNLEETDSFGKTDSSNG